jgi:hypothetical protein
MSSTQEKKTRTWAPLSGEQLEARRLVKVGPETVLDTSSTDIPGERNRVETVLSHADLGLF